jgi:hypothetical protein
VKVTYQGETKIAMIYRNGFREYLDAWISRMKPKEITLLLNDITTTHSYMKTVRFMKETDDVRNTIAPRKCRRTDDHLDDGGECMCRCDCPEHFEGAYGYASVMTIIANDIATPLSVEWQRISLTLHHANYRGDHS